MSGVDSYFDLLPLYVLDLLEERDTRRLEEHLSLGCSSCAEELRMFREFAGDIPWSLLPAAPPPHVRERILQAIKNPVEQPQPGVFVMRERMQAWRSTPYPGVTFMALHLDRSTENATTLLRMRPGAVYPSHRHAGTEQCLVLEGSCRIGSVSISRGDFQWADAGTRHDELTTDTGCLLLLIAHRKDEVFT